MKKMIKKALNEYRLASMEFWLTKGEYKLVQKYHDMSDEELIFIAIKRATSEKQNFVNDVRTYFKRRQKK